MSKPHINIAADFTFGQITWYIMHITWLVVQISHDTYAYHMTCSTDITWYICRSHDLYKITEGSVSQTTTLCVLKTLICGAHTTLLKIAKKKIQTAKNLKIMRQAFFANIIFVKTSTNAVLEIEYSSKAYIACTLWCCFFTVPALWYNYHNCSALWVVIGVII